MMQLNEFAEEVLAGVREKADGDFSAWTTSPEATNHSESISLSLLFI